jgi:molecular chaperone HtpG
MEKGKISVQTENIFPIIKKFLYSEQEIFLRELVSNAVDATTKLKTLANRGIIKGDLGDTSIEILLDKEARTLTIRDRGIGMSEEEVKKYLNQVAFSSAQEFLDKYKDEAGIIGHFGLGFYSAFMVAQKVEVITKSWQEDADAVNWSCDGDPSYALSPADKQERGTDIVLHIADDSTEYLESSRVEELLNRYCKFLPVPIKFGKTTETVGDTTEEDKEPETIEVDRIINNPYPIWKKKPSELTDEDYKSFYNELYPFSTPPMFWIHLKIDDPFNLTGVLYFPRIKNSFEVQKNKIQLYSNQVYVTDNVKDIVPEFLTLLHGVIDSPDIPLNVSRSYLQGDANVRKITGYITRKVADSINDLFKKDREQFHKQWEDLGAFVKYGMISEEKFYDRAVKFALLQNIENEFFTIEEYKEKVKAQQTDKHDKIVLLYTNDKEGHHAYIASCKEMGYDVLLMDNVLDNHFMQHLEHQMGDLIFVRVDSDTVDHLVQKETAQESVLSEEETNAIKALFTKVINNPGHQVVTKPLGSNQPPVVIVRPEFMRRWKEMQMLQGAGGNDLFGDQLNVVINANHPIIAQQLVQGSDHQEAMAAYVYQLALLNQNLLKGEQLANFVKHSLDLLAKN